MVVTKAARLLLCLVLLCLYVGFQADSEVLT